MDEKVLADTLYEATGRMLEIDESDIERAHIEADGILVDVMEVMAKNAADPHVRVFARRLIQEYERIPKWFA